MPVAASAAADTAALDKRRNVILIIGDGMDNQQITIARNYLVGVNGRLSLDNMSRRSIAQVLTVDESAPQRVVYVADSANSATAIASGQVTSRGRIATTASDDRDLTSIVKLAAAAGYKTGVVSTASITDATVAAFYANIRLRGCHNPTLMQQEDIYDPAAVDCSADLKANGGPGSIAEQLVNSPLDLALGGGHKHFLHPAEGQSSSLLELAKEAGFNVLTNVQQLDNGPAQQRWLGLFAADTLPVALRGENNRAAEKPKLNLLNRMPWSRDTRVLPAPMRCEANPKFGGTPSLQTMTRRALEKLGGAGGSGGSGGRGFFLMVESASIDKQAHWRNPCGSIGEVEQLDRALDEALAFAEKNPNTLVLVTADHGQAAQLVPAESLFNYFGVPINTPGKIARLHTIDNAIMVINYATNDFSMEEHTGVSVPVLSNNITDLPATMLQTELFSVMANHLQLKPRQQLTEAGW
ncbi:MAG: alkaline phosphatase [Pseudomonadales bacterium]|nr:alkaline phosphatase [Pseudomonadales bacterium]